jgi:hypothetical protein
MSTLRRARRDGEGLFRFRKKIDRCLVRVKGLLLPDSLSNVDGLFDLCSQSSYVACMSPSVLWCPNFLLLDDFPGGFLFYIWVLLEGDPWITTLLRQAQSVGLIVPPTLMENLSVMPKYCECSLRWVCDHLVNKLPHFSSLLFEHTLFLRRKGLSRVGIDALATQIR